FKIERINHAKSKNTTQKYRSRYDGYV
ncbi:MAG: hypothetical protein RLZ39_117, partial [Bacteroidota bacterium]